MIKVKRIVDDDGGNLLAFVNIYCKNHSVTVIDVQFSYNGEKEVAYIKEKVED